MAKNYMQGWFAVLRKYMRQWLKYAREALPAWFRMMRKTPPPPEYMMPNTLRFQFGQKGYDPVAAGVGTSGTWKHIVDNVWDWTNNNTSWASAFFPAAKTGAFMDYENNPVKVIAAGDTSSVTDFSRLFRFCSAITEFCNIDTSNATTTRLLFGECTNCEKFPSYLDFRKTTDCLAVFQGCSKLTKAPDRIDFPSDHNYQLTNFFRGCENLEIVPLYDISGCTSTEGMFMALSDSGYLTGIMRLKAVPLFNTSSVTNMTQMFTGCVMLTEIPNFDTSSVTSMNNMLSAFWAPGSGIDYKMNIAKVPEFDYSKCTNLAGFMRNNASIAEIPAMNVRSGLVQVGFMFSDCPNVKSGQKALYDKLSAISTITNHTDCFKDCGSDTEEGRAELAQIPASWGGTMEEA